MQHSIQDPWFKPKTIGWGWVPANSKGWLVILTFLIFVAVNVSTFIQIKEKTDSLASKFDGLTAIIIFYSLFQFVVNSLLAVIALVVITKLTNSKN